MTAAPPLSLPFRISTYSTLLVACVSLGYSEYDLVPESIVFTAVVVVSLVVSFHLEGRVALGLGKANLLGLIIGIVAVGWLAVKLTRPSNSVLSNLSWPANLLPYMGPLVMILIPAKLFRPKHVGDWWTMQGIGLATVVLASSMTDDPFFLVLVALYALGAVWSLTLFFSNRSAGAIPGLPGHLEVRPQLAGTSATTDGERGMWKQALFWLAAAGLVAFPIFFLSPRSTGERWAFTKTRIETGYNPENTHDMSKIGDLETNAEVAFEVRATDRDGTVRTDFDPNQLWRGASYSDYEIGNWIRKAYGSGHGTRFRVALPPEAYKAPDLGTGEYSLEFQGSEKVAGPVLSSPIIWVEGQQAPVWSVKNETPTGWSAFYDGSFLSPKLSGRTRFLYTQRTRPADEPGLGSAMEALAPFDSSQIDPERATLTRMRIPKIRDWAIDLLKRCVAAGRLPQAVINDADLRVGFVLPPEHFEAVARVFKDYFLNSGEFGYTMKLRRIDKKIDPIEDFLVNAKAGHCERFAAGLALCLRALGIPAQFVVGFKGYDVGDDSKILIRQEHAHAWVEVLIPRTAPADFRFKNPENAKADRVWHWLSLDPTPGTFASAPSGGNWFDEARQKGVSFVTDFIIGYNPAKRELAVETLKTKIVEWSLYFGGGCALIGTAFWLRRRWGGRSTPTVFEAESELVWYRRYLAALKQSGHSPSFGQTPKEFADAVAVSLQSTPVAAVPVFVTSKLYRVRYAGSALTPAEESEVIAAISSLETALRG